MKYQSTYNGSKSEFAEFIKKTIPELFSGKLSIEGKSVSIPSDAELDYKVKFNEDEVGSSITIKVAWESPNSRKDNDFDVDTD